MNYKLKLEIDGFGLINKSHIEINKINVVGGVNASGKSTASKLLYCFLKSMSLTRNDYVFEVLVQRVNRFINIMTQPNPYGDFIKLNKISLDDDLEDILELYEDSRKLYERLGNDFFETPIQESIDILVETIDELFNILLNDEYENDYSPIVKSLFNNESLLNFKGKSSFYNNLFKSSILYEETDDFYEIFGRKEYLKSKDISFDNYDSNFIYKTEGDVSFLNNNVFYIDSISTFDLDYYINSKNTDYTIFGYKEHVEYLLNQIKDEEIETNLSQDIIDKMDSIRKKISNFIGGYIDIDGKRMMKSILHKAFYFHPNNSDEMYKINISSGIQQISLVEILLAKYKLQPGSFLIIDEPEVNLHPEWQFKFAEILVLLAKELDITLYMNSHSPMFIEAMEVLTQYYDLEEDTNFYLTEKHDENTYDFIKIEYDNLYEIYDNLAKPFDAIEVYRLKNEYKKGNY